MVARAGSLIANQSAIVVTLWVNSPKVQVSGGQKSLGARDAWRTLMQGTRPLERQVLLDKSLVQNTKTWSCVLSNPQLVLFRENGNRAS